MIVKVQRSIATSEAVPQILVYNKSESYQAQFSITPEWEKIMNGKLKVFMHAKLVNGVLVTSHPAPWQEW